jgi:adenylate cyclase
MPFLPGVEVMSTAITRLIAGDAHRPGPSQPACIRCGSAAVALPVLVDRVCLGWRRSAVRPMATIAAVALLWVAASTCMAFALRLLVQRGIACSPRPCRRCCCSAPWSCGFDRRRATRFAAESDLLQRIEAPGLGEWLARDPSFLSGALCGRTPRWCSSTCRGSPA